jgi:hypothetical protein
MLIFPVCAAKETVETTPVIHAGSPPEIRKNSWFKFTDYILWAVYLQFSPREHKKSLKYRQHVVFIRSGSGENLINDQRDTDVTPSI